MKKYCLLLLIASGFHANAQFTKLFDFVSENDLGTYSTSQPVTDGTWLYGTTNTGGVNDFGVIFKIQTDGSGYMKLAEFETAGKGKNPVGSLTLSNGVLYGMTSNGGASDQGVIFKIYTTGEAYTKLHDFDGSDGSQPQGSLTISGDTIFGMTEYAGANGGGVIFKMNTDGTGYAKLWDFEYGSGKNPAGTLTQSGSSLYGTTTEGGDKGSGGIFSINTDGSGFRVLHFFDSSTEGVYTPGALAISEADSMLYGTLGFGGPNSNGTIFKMKTDGSIFSILFDSFDGDNGMWPYYVFIGSGSALYGSTASGTIGPVIFKINNDGTGYSKIFQLSPGWFQGGVLLSGIKFYGMSNLANGLNGLFKVNLDGTGYLEMMDFGKAPMGSSPQNRMVREGNVLYGTTSSGGLHNQGIIYKINDDGSAYTKLFEFNDSITGAYPNGISVLSGNFLYGATGSGGTNHRGVIYRVNKDGTNYTKLFEFNNDTLTGSSPTSLTISGSQFYGLTQNGGTYQNGIIFKINTDGSNFVRLYEFNHSDTLSASNPRGSLVVSGSRLYGTTNSGGAHRGGVVFRINTDGTNYSNLFNFVPNDTINGYYPSGSLAMMNSVLYGTSRSGGAYLRGTIFKINTDGTGFMKLHDFNEGSGDKPILVSGNNLYGISENGGINDMGYIFRLNLDGTGFEKLAEFDGKNMGLFPYSLILSDCKLYGTAIRGGTYNAGVIYKYDLPPIFISAQPGPEVITCANTGTNVGITATGNNLLYQWQVSADNGNSWSDITATGNNPSYSNWNSSELEINSLNTDITGRQYRCVVSGSCTLTSDPAALTVKRPVELHIKLKWGDVLICYNLGDSLNAYQWYKNNVAIPNATGQYYVTNKQAGSYYVVTTDKNSCSDTSRAVIIGLKSFSVYPNPAQAQFVISLDDEITGELTINLYNLAGERVLQAQTNKGPEDLNYKLPVAHLHAGIYIMELRMNGEPYGMEKVTIRQ